MSCTDKHSSDDKEIENVRVFIRVRPLREEEKTVKNKNLLEMNQTLISLKKIDTIKSFSFSRIFNEHSTQIDIYRSIAVPIVQQVLRGYNGTIFAYGQSGTGKTYTMIGDIFNTELRGIVPNIFSHIFARISMANNESSYAVTATYLEIYNEEIRDLLSETPEKKLALREKPELGVFVNDLLGFTVNSLEEIMEILAKGNKNRATGCTKLNESSSRSHAIFAMLIETKNNVTGKTTFGKLNLVDLAGSERVHKTMATGDRLKEAGKINLSLSVLANVISALVDGKSTHIPYRNSKLTRLLQDSLGGNSLTAMIAMISPNILDTQESLYTLMYADRVKHIQNRVTVNIEKESLIQTLEAKIKELRNQLQTLSMEEERQKIRKRSRTSLNKDELIKIEEEKNMLQKQIDMVQKKILVGGQNLVEKAQQQMESIESTAMELKHLDSSHQLLEEILFYKEKEKELVVRNYATLQDEDKELDRKIKETEKILSKATQILVTKETEYQNEISSMLHANKSLAKEMSLVKFIMNQSTPKEYLDEIESKITWDESMQEWQMKGIAYCGNNLRRSRSRPVTQSTSSKSIYFKYPSKSRK